MKTSEIQFAANLEALSIPQCRLIVEALLEGSLTQGELSKKTKLSPASIEKHLEKLISAGLVKIRLSNGSRKVHLQHSVLGPTASWFASLV